MERREREPLRFDDDAPPDPRDQLITALADALEHCLAGPISFQQDKAYCALLATARGKG